MRFKYGPLRWSRTLVLVANLFFSFSLNEFVIAGEGAAAEPTPALAEMPAPVSEPAPETSHIVTFGKTMDETHSILERKILEQTVRFDDFFGDVNTENLHQTKYELRLRNSIRVEHGGDLKFGASLRANFALSRISERLRIFITGEDDPELSTQSLPRDPGNPGFDRTTPSTHFANTELRYEVIQTPSVNLFLGAGVRLALPFEAFVRSRFQHTRQLGEVSLMRFAETFFVKNTDLLGETTELSFERLLGRDTIIRWAGAGTASQEIEGLEWGSEISMIRALSPRSAITLTGGLSGITNSSALVQNYRLLARYRRNFFRNWLFYELEPEISWPSESDGSYPAELAFTFRIEVVFQGTATHIVKTSRASSTEGPDQNWKR